MGRRRESSKHLPANMQHKHGAYYFVRAQKWVPLGKTYAGALVKYADLVGSKSSLRTVKDAVWGYIEHSATKAKPLAPATLAGYRYNAANLCAVFGHLELADITPAMVYRYLSEAGTVQANRDKALLSAAFTHARNCGVFSGIDPTKDLQFRNDEQPRKRYVTDAELEKAVKSASPKLGCIVQFCYLTGMRQGDALRVKLSDLNDEGITYTPGKTAKRTGKTLVVTWSPELREVVDEAKRLWRRFGREYLFESRPKGKHAARGPGPYTPSGLRALWRVARENAGLTDMRLHDLRRKAASDVGEDAAPGLMAHADGKVTKRHYRARPERVKPVR